jgi:hypothetical protein
VQKAGSKLSEIAMAFGKGIMFKMQQPEGWRNNPAVLVFIIKDENSSKYTQFSASDFS